MIPKLANSISNGSAVAEPAVLRLDASTATSHVGAQISATGYQTSRALLSGWLQWFSAGLLSSLASVLAMQFLSFPGLFIDSGRLFGGPKTTLWLWAFWHIGLALSILHFAWTKHARPGLTTVDHKHAQVQVALA